ncbi:uncharacterized protein METZ01_LOCUS210191, partial [marine metagenome]
QQNMNQLVDMNISSGVLHRCIVLILMIMKKKKNLKKMNTSLNIYI